MPWPTKCWRQVCTERRRHSSVRAFSAVLALAGHLFSKIVQPKIATNERSGSAVATVTEVLDHLAYGVRGEMRAAIIAAFVVGCTALPVSMVVKPPLENECNRMPIQGCGPLVDAVLLYVGGDKPAATQQLARVKQANTPADLERFGKALRETASMPGASSVAGPLNEVADLLSSAGGPAMPASPGNSQRLASTQAPREIAVPAGSSAAIVGEKRREPQPDYATRALSATSDVTRIISSSFNLAEKGGRVSCRIAGVSAVCFRSLAGPLIITDVIGASGCSDRLFIGAAKSDTPDLGFDWAFEARDPAVTGTRFAVRGGEWLFFAIAPVKKDLSESPECQVSWSGFRPWIVPLMTTADEPPAWRQKLERR